MYGTSCRQAAFVNIALQWLKCEMFCRRFDFGAGMGLVRTKNTALVDRWNALRLDRTIWNVFVRLNDGPAAKGDPKVYHCTISTEKQLRYFATYNNLHADCYHRYLCRLLHVQMQHCCWIENLDTNWRDVMRHRRRLDFFPLLWNFDLTWVKIKFKLAHHRYA